MIVLSLSSHAQQLVVPGPDDFSSTRVGMSLRMEVINRHYMPVVYVFSGLQNSYGTYLLMLSSPAELTHIELLRKRCLIDPFISGRRNKLISFDISDKTLGSSSGQARFVLHKSTSNPGALELALPNGVSSKSRYIASFCVSGRIGAHFLDPTHHSRGSEMVLMCGHRLPIERPPS